MADIASKLRSPGFKLFIIGLLTVLMAVPLMFIEFALTDRQERASEAQQDVANGWGGLQVVAGPLLFVPYEQKVTSVVDGRAVETTQRFTAVLLPSNLNLDTRTDMGRRWRGIFPVPVYRASTAIKAMTITLTSGCCRLTVERGSSNSAKWSTTSSR